MPLPSDTFHNKLFACDQRDDADYDACPCDISDVADYDYDDAGVIDSQLFTFPLPAPGCGALQPAAAACSAGVLMRFIRQRRSYSQLQIRYRRLLLAASLRQPKYLKPALRASSSGAFLAMRLETLPAMGPHRLSSSSTPCRA